MKYFEMSNVTLFAMGLDPAIGCALSKHVIEVANNDMGYSSIQKATVLPFKYQCRSTLYDTVYMVQGNDPQSYNNKRQATPFRVLCQRHISRR